MNRKRMSLAIFLLLIFLMPVAAQFNPSPAVIAPTPPEAGARFGAALATADVNGDGLPDIIVGVPFATVGNQAEAGKVLVYFGGKSFDMRMKPDATLQAPTPVPGAHFGWVLAVGNVGGDATADILVGAPGDTGRDSNNNPVLGAGRVYGFFGSRSLDMKAPDVTLQAPTPQAGARFGVSIAVGDFNGGGADIVVGANLTDVTTGMMPMQTVVVDAGQAYVFFGTDFKTTATLQAATPQAGAHFGTSVAAANLNNDMFDDVVVGSDRTNVMSMNATQPNAGEVVVFFGNMTGMMMPFNTTVNVTLHGATIQPGAAFGRAIVVGDVNGDGIKDVVVSAPLFNPSPSLRNVGEAYLFQGAASITGTPAANATIRGQIASSTYYGTSLALGDVNGDGLIDLIGGAPGAEVAGLANAGRAFVFLNGVPLTGTLTSTIALQSSNPEVNGRFGQAVAAADLNQDGLADVIVGAPFETVGGVPNAGRVYVFFSIAPTVPFIVNQ